MNILLIGDSLVEYFDWQERFPDHNIVNLGVAGESVEGLLSRTAHIKDNCPEADIIFIMSGINNVAMGDLDFAGPYRIILEKLAGFYPDAGIYVHSLLPVRVDFISDDSIRSINSILRTMAHETGAAYLDIYSRFVDTQGRPIREYLMDDGVHLSAQGYIVWSNLLEGIIEQGV